MWTVTTRHLCRSLKQNKTQAEFSYIMFTTVTTCSQKEAARIKFWKFCTTGKARQGTDSWQERGNRRSGWNTNWRWGAAGKAGGGSRLIRDETQVWSTGGAPRGHLVDRWGTVKTWRSRQWQQKQQRRRKGEKTDQLWPWQSSRFNSSNSQHRPHFVRQYKLSTKGSNSSRLLLLSWQVGTLKRVL